MKYSLLALTLLLVSACGNEHPPETSDPSFADVDVVTGIQLTDAAGQLVGLWGQPNQKPGSLLLFPNPAGDIVALGLPADSTMPSDMSDVWIVPADCLRDDDSTDILLQSLSLNYTLEEVDTLAISQLSPQIADGGFIQLDLSTIENGFYRIFVVDSMGSLFWVNMYKNSDSGSQVLQFAALDQACQ